jgi:hypothetical protein
MQGWVPKITAALSVHQIIRKERKEFAHNWIKSGKAKGESLFFRNHIRFQMLLCKKAWIQLMNMWIWFKHPTTDELNRSIGQERRINLHISLWSEHIQGYIGTRFARSPRFLKAKVDKQSRKIVFSRSFLQVLLTNFLENKFMATKFSDLPLQPTCMNFSRAQSPQDRKHELHTFSFSHHTPNPYI